MTERQRLQVSDAKEVFIRVQDEGFLSGGLGPVASFFFFFYGSKLLPSIISLWPEGFSLAFSLLPTYSNFCFPDYDLPYFTVEDTFLEIEFLIAFCTPGMLVQLF